MNKVVLLDFYPRTPVECDAKLKEELEEVEISIHALLWSATKILLVS